MYAQRNIIRGHVLHDTILAVLSGYTRRYVLMSLLKELCLGEDWLKAMLGYVQGDLKSGWSLQGNSFSQ